MKFKSLRCAAAVVGIALLWTQSASADLVKTSSVVVSVTSDSTTFAFNNPSLNNVMTVGAPLTINDFIVATISTIQNSDNSGVISAAFTFTDPTSANNTDTGTITGSFSGSSSNLNSISVTWGAPVTVNFTNGESLVIDLADTTFNCPNPHCASGNSFDIAGIFTLNATGVNNVSAVPGPVVGAGLPGLLAGFGAVLAWRRKRRTAV